MQKDAQSALRGGPGPRHQCQACEKPLHTCWKFKEDDHYCGLCGERVLHLVSTQPFMDEDRPRFHLPPLVDRDLCRLYWHPGEKLRLILFWALGTADRLGRRSPSTVPQIDLDHCRAHFNGPPVGDLFFRFGAVQTDPQAGLLLVRLVPREGSAIPSEVPETGIWGSIRIACEPGPVVRDALLLPHPQRPIDCLLDDPVLRSRDRIVRIHERAKDIRMSMRLSPSVPVWVLGCRVEMTDANLAGSARVEGLTLPLLVSPDHPCPFDLVLDSSGWQADRPVPFQLTWSLLGLAPEVTQGRLLLVGGPRLHVDDSTVRSLREPVQLGQVEELHLPLSIEGGEEDRVSVVGCTPYCQGNWLSVLSPSIEHLPMTVENNGSQPLLQLQIDTTRLDRPVYDEKRLVGRVELIDARRIKKTVLLEIPVKRAEELRSWLAFDWGTTNSCAAYSTAVGVRPQAVPLDDQQARNLERFPSDVYFEDVRNRDNPSILIGHKAAARTDRRECLLHSVKRKFQFRDEVTVVDERGRQETYTLVEVVGFVLHKLVSQAEKMGRFEVRRLGFTFPTKWPPRVRRKFQKVLDGLQERLATERGCKVELQELEIDEANAVAIELLTSGEKLPEGKFHLVAYDFGGGTIDTSVLEVTSADVRRPITRYIGIGGRHEFGGDEVTRAVMMLLRERLTAALQRRELRPDRGSSLRLVEIPLVPDGQLWQDDGRPHAAERNRQARQNWEVFRDIAEKLKFELCATASMTQRVSPIGSLSLHLQHITCCLVPAVNRGPGAVAEGPEELRSLDDVVLMLEEPFTALAEDLKVTLAEVCNHRLDDIEGTNNRQEFTVCDRVQDTIDELTWQCKANGVWPDIIVLAGGGCRLPLVGELMRAAFERDGALPVVVAGTGFSKQRVAHGLAKFLDMRRGFGYGEGLARSVDVLHHDLGFRRLVARNGGSDEEFIPFVRVGTRFGEDWHPVRFAREDIILADGGALLRLAVRKWRKGILELGHIDLMHPQDGEPGDEPGIKELLPLAEGQAYEGLFRMRRLESRDHADALRDHRQSYCMELCVSVGERRHAYYRLVITDTDPETLLQE
jgi:hypothetical protein